MNPYSTKSEFDDLGEIGKLTIPHEVVPPEQNQFDALQDINMNPSTPEECNEEYKESEVECLPQEITWKVGRNCTVDPSSDPVDFKSY